MKFSVTLHAQASAEVVVYADSPEEAVKLAQETRPKLEGDARPNDIQRLDEVDGEEHSVESWEVVGSCEVCDKLLLQSDEKGAPEVYRAIQGDDDEVYRFCLACAAEAKADAP